MNRFILMVLITPLSLTFAWSQDEAVDRPNLVLIIADDMNWNDCGAYGHPSIATPHLDKLAEDGMRFNHAYLMTSSCSPSRASIITGTYPHQTDAEQLHWPIPKEQITFVELLKESGYWTAQAGKWHMGEAIKERFDLIAPSGSAGFLYSADDSGTKPTKIKSDGSGCQEWVPLLQQRPTDQPFFLWLAASDPHRGYTSDTPSRNDLSDARIPPYMPDNDSVRLDFKEYYDEVSRLDHYVGDVVSELDRAGLSDNTLVLFITDNGRPFPRDKTTLYNGGIKTPWIVKWPARVPANSTSEVLVSAVDIASTFLRLGGIEPPDRMMGEDFSSAFSTDEEIRSFAYAEDHWHDHDDFTRAVVTKEYKYIRNFYPELPNTPPADALRSKTFQSMLKLRDADALTKDQMSIFQSPRPQEELYDLKRDPFELNNLASAKNYQEVLVRMQSYLEDIRSETKDVLPGFRTPDEFDRETGLPLPNRKRPRPSKAEMSKSH